MKKSELKGILRPIIKELLMEELFYGDLLSSIIKEAISGTFQAKMMLEQKDPPAQEPKEEPKEQLKPRKEGISAKAKETRKRMLEAIGSDAYNNVDLFEGTSPIAEAGVEGDNDQRTTAKQGPLRDRDPNDPGVDISAFFKR